MHSKLGQPRYLSIMTITKSTPAAFGAAAALFLVSFVASAQSPCPEDSLALNVTVTTDAWGYELYWELIDASAECGDGSALVWGGNPEVGCGEGVPGLPGEVYPNNQVIVAPTVCVSEEDSLVLVHRDSYGDGGSQFSIALSGNEAFAYGGTGGGNDWAFQPVVISGDLPCLAETIYADSASWVGSTSDATVSPNEPAPPGLGCGTFGGWCESGLSNTVWLSWPVPADGGVFEITTCNVETTFDTQLALWRADDCADFSTFELLNANDDNGCGLGAYRSTLLTPCLEGGEELLLQIDGYYGETGTLEVSIVSTSPEAWALSAGVQNISCNLESAFNPDGAIYPNTNVGANSVDWSWTGPFGFTSDDAAIGPLLPGTYALTAGFCGQTFEAEYLVEEPAPIDVSVTLTANCEEASMQGVAEVAGGQGVASATWTTGTFETTGIEVSGLPPGLCQVEVTDDNGCEATEWVWVESVGVPNVDLGPDLFGCAGDNFTLLAPLGNGLSYEWTTGQTGALAVVPTETPGTLVVGVEVTDEAGCSASDVVILTLDDCTSGMDALSMNDLRAYPNPVAAELNVDLPSEVALSALALRDNMGREVPCDWIRSGQVATTTLDVPSGVYLLQVRGREGALRVVKL